MAFKKISALFLAPMFLTAWGLCGSMSMANASAPTPESVQPMHEEEINDPFESFNRFIFSMNLGFDDYLLRPTAIVYRTVVPTPVRSIVHTTLQNLTLPLTITASLLQGKVKQGFAGMSRLLVNVIAGAGIVDVATDCGMDDDWETCDSTLAHYKVPQGPYLMLPIIGPACPRDIVGRVGDYFADPLRYQFKRKNRTGYSLSKRAIGTVDRRVELLGTADAMRKSSLDFYVMVRSYYAQRKEMDDTDTVEDSPVPIQDEE